MGIVDLKSLTLTDLEASPSVPNSVLHNHGRLRVKSDWLESDSGDSDTSTFRFFRVRSSDSIKSLRVYNNGISSGTDYDCGLYTINGGSVLTNGVDLYADGFTLATLIPSVPHITATSAYQELRFGDATTSIMSDINNAVWQDLGLSTDPFLEYDMVLTGNTVGGGGLICLMMFYTSGD